MIMPKMKSKKFNNKKYFNWRILDCNRKCSTNLWNNNRKHLSRHFENELMEVNFAKKGRFLFYFLKWILKTQSLFVVEINLFQLKSKKEKAFSSSSSNLHSWKLQSNSPLFLKLSGKSDKLHGKKQLQHRYWWILYISLLDSRVPELMF